jgi:hypothetical protein
MNGSLIALSLAATLISATAWAGFCTGKQNGLWCDGAKLVTCSGGNVAGSQDCPAGCESMPTGVPDKCRASGPCVGKANGLWCSGSQLVTCKNGAVAASQFCPNRCQSMPDGVPDQCKAAPGPCTGQRDGKWCSGSELLTCKGGGVASQQHCDFGCIEKPPGVPDECAPKPQPPDPPKDWCDGKGGLLINDPWGGKERIRLENGTLGKYVVDSLASFWVGGKSGGSGAIDGNGDPVPDDELPGKVVYTDPPPEPTPTEAEAVTTDAGTVATQGDASSAKPRDTASDLANESSATAIPPTNVGGSAPPPVSGCTSGRDGSALGMLALAVLGLLGIRVRRLRLPVRFSSPPA